MAAPLRVRPVEVPRQPLRRELAAGWAEVRARTWYWSSIIGHGACNFALGMLMTTGPLIAITELGGKGAWLAAPEASAAGYLAGALIAGRARVSRGVLAVDLVLASFAAPLVLFALPGVRELRLYRTAPLPGSTPPPETGPSTPLTSAAGPASRRPERSPDPCPHQYS